MLFDNVIDKITNLNINDHILFNKNAFLQNPKKYNLILRLIDLGKLAVKT